MLEACLLQPRIDLGRDALPEGQVYGKKRGYFVSSEMGASLDESFDRSPRVYPEGLPEFFIRYQPADDGFNPALRHNVLQFGRLP